MLRIASGVAAIAVVAGQPNYDGEWKAFKDKFQKSYNGNDEEQHRFGIFKENLDLISKTNAENLGYSLGVNAFADLTSAEITNGYTGLKPKELWGALPNLGTMKYSGKALASSVDWTTKGAVTPVKNQGQCGSCWSFSTTGALEGAWKLAGNSLTSLSEQQFVDCDKVDSGCSGGLMDNAFRYAEQNALCTENSYPYTARGGSCQKSSCTVGIPEGKVTGYKDVSADDEQALMEAVTQQPVSIAIEADKSAFQRYSSGILSSTCGTNLDHGVLLVGYGSENGQDYWKVKNSWGTSFGENGYIRLLRGKGGAGECGLLKQPSFPVIGGSVQVSDPVSEAWDNFKRTFQKVYNGNDEESKRFEIFRQNLDVITTTNAKNLSYKLGVNVFADLTSDEITNGYTGLKPKELWGALPNLGTDKYSGKALASSVDWTTQGAVTPVKNQGQCGSCWSFSTTGALEGAWKIAGNSLTSLSEQQFVDCDKVDSGCSGGLMDNAFRYAEQNAICTENSYPYTARGGSCQKSSCTVGIPQGGVTGYKDVSADDEQALMEAVTKQPVSIAIEADKSAFQRYSSGILSSTCGTNLDHGVLLVGYGSENGQDYWKVKNSWGTSFGENGYIRLLRGKGGAGECGLLKQPSYPVVSGASVINV